MNTILNQNNSQFKMVKKKYHKKKNLDGRQFSLPRYYNVNSIKKIFFYFITKKIIKNDFKNPRTVRE